MILGDARSNTSAFGPTVLTLLRNTAKADPLNDLLLIECIHFLQANSPARYASDIEKIYQQYMTQKQIRIAVAKYGFTLDRNDGDRIIQLLESATDDDIRYLLHVRRLRLGLESKIDDTLLKNIISTAFDYRPGRAIRIGEILGHLAQINDENKTTLNARIQILNAIRTSAESNKMEFLAESTTSFDDDDDPDFFGFGTSSSRFGVSRKEFEGAFRAAVGLFAMNISQNGGTISESIIAHLRFWLPKAWRAGDALNYSGHLTLGDDPELLLETTDGQTLKRSTLPNVVVLTIAQKNGKDQLTAKWRDESDRVQISSIISMKDLSSESLRADGVWRKPTSRW